MIGLLQHTIFTIAQLDYPYPTDFIGTSLPGHSADVACQVARGGDLDHPAERSGAECAYRRPARGLWTTCPGSLTGPGPSSVAPRSCCPAKLARSVSWRDQLVPRQFLGCEVFFWDFDQFLDNCADVIEVRSSPTTLPITYGGGDINASSNIMLSRGQMPSQTGVLRLRGWAGGRGIRSTYTRSYTVEIKAPYTGNMYTVHTPPARRIQRTVRPSLTPAADCF